MGREGGQGDWVIGGAVYALVASLVSSVLKLCLKKN